MDIDFLIQDTFALTRPQWKLVGNLEDAGRAFAAAVTQNYKTQEVEKAADPEEADDDASFGEGPEEDELRVPEMDEAQSSSEEAELEVNLLPCDFTAKINSIIRLCLVKIEKLTRILRRISLLPAKRRSMIPKRRLISIESSRS